MLYAYEEGLTTQTEQNGNIVRFYIDDKYRIYKEEYLDGTVEKVFNGLDRIVSYKDKNNNIWLYDHDNRGNVIMETDPLGYITRYTYNELDQVTSITKPNFATNQYMYDSQGNLTLSIDPTEGLLASLTPKKPQPITNTIRTATRR